MIISLLELSECCGRVPQGRGLGGMWSTVATLDCTTPAPSARSKHSATLVGDHVYLLGGRNGNLPLKDFWSYNLVTGKWQQLKPTGDKLPCLQEHSAIAHKENIYVFGGEVGFSAGSETPLWIYDIKANTWRKVRSKKGCAAPKGRRGHTALVFKGSMFIYGGYQDLRGSSSELWAFHFDTESWHLISSSSKGVHNNDCFPAPRHKHSCIIHDDSLWIYGGMTDLQERSDLWRWDSRTRVWTNVKTKVNPGPLHSHAACRFPSFMIIFGGERGGNPTNELWKFHFGAETWEKMVTPGLKPSPRAESIALTISELLLKDPSVHSLETKAAKVRSRTCNSADRGGRHSSYLPSNRVAPSEKTYVFNPSQNNYTDGSNDFNHQQNQDNRSSRSFLQEISKLSQINISRLNNKCSYTVLTGCNGDSTESLLKQHASPQNAETELNLEMASSTPARSKMVKSKSAFVIKKNSPEASPDDNKEYTTKKRVEFDMSSVKITRDPISVPNFSLINLPTPVLTPVEAAKLVYLDTDDENDLGIEYRNNRENALVESELNVLKRSDSYSSHLGYADNPLYQHMVNSNSCKLEENISSTSDYASIETMNRLSSASNYSVKTTTPLEENVKNRERDKPGPFGFCNPNYMRPDVKSNLINGDQDRKAFVQILNNVAKGDSRGSQEDILEMQNCNESYSRNTKVLYRNSARLARPPKSLSIDCGARVKDNNKCRALSASGVDRRKKLEKVENNNVDNTFPFFMYLIGGKEHGQVTVFQRPISIWKLKLC
ncbi:RING finger protein B-like isoform X2 [Coccinella septempunctata]|uniref:RING finger protein B-like isoform X2 n=1 Tax=Coccinella septempunctata TaxID=41139 RepID=UPI001D0814E6|nr:RING finger protein B-like isoform X2 [Coccinella septempunctata]